MREAGFMFAAWACGMVRSHLAAGKALQGAGTFCKNRGATGTSLSSSACGVENGMGVPASAFLARHILSTLFD